MKLYVCWGTAGAGHHACGTAAKALRDAGHEPEVIKGYGSRLLPDRPFNMSTGRRRARELTGSNSLPVLELDDGSAVAGGDRIAAWAAAHPAR
jgi:hypothetical protein